VKHWWEVRETLVGYLMRCWWEVRETLVGYLMRYWRKVLERGCEAVVGSWWEVGGRLAGGWREVGKKGFGYF